MIQPRKISSQWHSILLFTSLPTLLLPKQWSSTPLCRSPVNHPLTSNIKKVHSVFLVGLCMKHCQSWLSKAYVYLFFDNPGCCSKQLTNIPPHSTRVGTLLNYQQEPACQLSVGLLLVALSNQKEATKGQCTFMPHFCTGLFGTQNKEVSYGAANPDGLCLA